jgi:hypothetical protein
MEVDILGDFNADLLRISPASKRLIDFVSGIGGLQTVSVPTRHGKTLLDLVIFGDGNRHVSTSVLPPITTSDQNTIIVLNYLVLFKKVCPILD